MSALIPDTNIHLLQWHSQVAALCWTKGSLGTTLEARQGSAAAVGKFSVFTTAETYPLEVSTVKQNQPFSIPRLSETL